jgi:hypothetical protein
MDEIIAGILKALPAGSAAMVIAIIALAKQLIAERKECKDERLQAAEQHRKELAEKDAKISELTKEQFRTLMMFLELQEKHERLRADSSSPPRN